MTSSRRVLFLQGLPGSFFFRLGKADGAVDTGATTGKSPHRT